ncbi:hypothetical protein EVAR_47632_1 [Eumeta japonica]|uniref:Uncharacterized protein n=1 Tax=Eumeta variegata TaxID=151549 RepID=A0A4C1Z9C3_EUMVA|nr:hypothetical protein EVAR_47632_1 [Eumeta japonica]
MVQYRCAFELPFVDLQTAVISSAYIDGLPRSMVRDANIKGPSGAGRRAPTAPAYVLYFWSRSGLTHRRFPSLSRARLILNLMHCSVRIVNKKKIVEILEANQLKRPDTHDKAGGARAAMYFWKPSTPTEAEPKRDSVRITNTSRVRLRAGAVPVHSYVVHARRALRKVGPDSGDRL